MLFSFSSIPDNKFDSPGVGDIPNIAYCLPFLMSASIKTTFFPACANVTAKLEATQLFPSPGNVDVTNIVFIFLFAFINCIFVLNVLNTSEIGDFGSLCAITSFLIIFYLLFHFRNCLLVELLLLLVFHNFFLFLLHFLQLCLTYLLLMHILLL